MTAMGTSTRSVLDVVIVVDAGSPPPAQVVDRVHRSLRRGRDDDWSLHVVDRSGSDANWRSIASVVDRLDLTTATRVGRHIVRRSIAEHWQDSAADTVALLNAGDEASIDAHLAVLAARHGLHDEPVPGLTRRRALLLLAGGAGVLAVAACGRSSSSSNASRSTTTTVAGATRTALQLTPEMTDGPYYLDLNLTRSDIVEDRTGAPLALTLAVVDTSGQPIAGAAVDIWHCDANGLYSGFVSASSGANGGSSTADDGTFLRGTQVAGADGKVTFKTIYPGWYRGRSVHIHVKVHAGGRTIHTGQLFFDDAFTDTVFRSTAPYSSRGTRDTRNANDGIFRGGGTSTVLAVKLTGSSYSAEIPTVVKRA